MINNGKDYINNKISIGTAQFGLNYGISNVKGKTSKQEVKKILNFAKQNNIISIDTALAYGESEKVLGSIGVSDFDVVTKMPPIGNSTINIENLINENFKSSLQRLHLNSLEGILIHNDNDLLGKNGSKIFRSLQFLKQEGFVRKIGISSYNPEIAEKIIDNFEIDLIQGPLNIFDRRFISSGLLDKLSKSNIEFHSRSAFLQGLLLMNKNSLPIYFSKWNSQFVSFANVLRDSGITALEACVNYSLSIENINKVIFGIESLSQLQEILKAVYTEIDTNIFNQLETDDPMLINPSLWPC